MKSILKYPGAKNRLAKWIVQFIPEHKVYVEVCFGSGGVFFNKPRSDIETINDIYGEVTNFFQVVRDSGRKLSELISLTPYGRDEYNKSYEVSEDSIERARRFAIRCWMGFGASSLYKNGFKTGQQSKSPNPAMGWNNLPQTILDGCERLKGVQIENLDAIELIGRYNTEDVFIYCDPPYLPSTRKNYLYKHEMTEKQHVELLTALLRHPGKVLISGYDNELYNGMLVGWHKVHTKTQAEGGLKRIETLWANYPLVTQMKIL